MKEVQKKGVRWPQVLVLEHRTHSAAVQYGRATAPAQWPRVHLPHTWVQYKGIQLWPL